MYEKRGFINSIKYARINRAIREIEELELEIQKAKLRKELDKITDERINEI